MNAAPRTLVTAMTEVWDRSMPPSSRTNVCPTAMANSGHMLEKMFARLCGDSIEGTIAAITKK